MQGIEEVRKPEQYLTVEQHKDVNSSVKLFQEVSKEIVVKDDATMGEANDFLIRISTKQKGIEQFRLAIVKPFKDHLKKIDEYFKDLAFQFDEPKETLTNKITEYRRKKAEKERKEREALEAKAKAAEASGDLNKANEFRTKDTKTQAPEKTQSTESGSATWIKKAEFKIVNPTLIPKEFWIVDEKKIGARLREIEKSLEVGRIYDVLIPGAIVTVTERPSLRGEVGGS